MNGCLNTASSISGKPDNAPRMEVMMEKQLMAQVLANPSGFSTARLIQARDALFDLAEQDTEAGAAAQKMRDMLTTEIQRR